MTTSAFDDGGFAATLRSWRRARGMSQFDLAETVGVSTRHLSFLETGRAKPSREMALALAEGLMAPLAARNALLIQAGFAPVYPATPLQGEALEPFRRMLSDLMDRHAPNPAMVCDRCWTIQDANATARLLLAPLQGSAGEANIVRMLTDNPLASDLIENYAEVLVEMHGRIRLEALEAGVDPALQELLAALERAMDRIGVSPGSSPRRPLAPVALRTPDGVLRFLSAIAHFGTSHDVTVRDLRLELLCPADDPTRAAMAALG
jgi:transcriptional regulator with XRE-family HTH domain